MSSRDFADNLQQQARTIGLEKIAQLLTAYQKQNEPIEDDALIQWFMYAPEIDLHDLTIVIGPPNFVEPVDHDGYGLFGYRKQIPDLVDAYDLIHDNSNMTGHTFPKPGNTEFQPASVGVKFSGAVTFGGTDYMIINDNSILKPTDAITIVGWFYLKKTSQTQHLVKMQVASTPYNLRIANTNELRIRIRTDNAGGTTYNKDIVSGNWTDNQWNHIVATWSGAPDNRLRIYLNKVKEGADVITAGALLYSGTDGLGIGAGPAGGSNIIASGSVMSWLSILKGEADQAWINNDFDGIRNVDTDVAGNPKEITTIPFIDSLQAMPNAFAGMFIGS